MESAVWEYYDDPDRQLSQGVEGTAQGSSRQSDRIL